MAQIVVGIADCAVSEDPEAVLITYALGSCIGVTVYDPVAKVGGLLHFMLPERTPELNSRQNPYMFADTGVPLLLEQVTAKGAAKKRLIVRTAGGAQMLQDGIFNIGKRNHTSLRKVLWKAGLLVESEAIGGSVSRTVSLDVATGKYTIRETAVQAIQMPQRKPQLGEK